MRQKQFRALIRRVGRWSGGLAACWLCFLWGLSAWADITAPQVSQVQPPVAVAWDFCEDVRVVGYNVKYGQLGVSNLTVIDVHNTNYATLDNAQFGSVHWVYATSYDAYGNESEPSETLYFTLAGSAKPNISTQPSDVQGLVGGRVALTVGATGATPLRYQWRWQGVPLAGATNAMLNLSPLAFSQAGFYDVVVSNIYGAVTSRTARLTVVNALAFGNLSADATSLSASASAPVAASLGWYHGLAILRDGTVMGWGNNAWKQTAIPAGLGQTVAVGAGAYHSVALDAKGTITAWGMGLCGQLAVPAQLDAVKAIAVGGFHSLALASNSQVVAWGYNCQGQCTVPAGMPSIKAIAAGSYHSLALTQDGTVVVWGDNSQRQCAVPAGLSQVVAIAAGGYHSVAVKADGTVVCWGDNRYGQLEPPSDAGVVTAVACGQAHTIALRANGTVVSWGHYQYQHAEDLARVQNAGQVVAGADRSLVLGE